MKKSWSVYLALILLLPISYLSFGVYQIEAQKRKIKEDLIELSKVKYGLFNVDEWKHILADIITKKIEDFNLEGVNKAEMRTKISDLLYKAIGDFEERYYEQKSRTILGLLESGVTSIFGAFNTIRKDVPKFTEQILEFIDDPENRKAIRNYLVDKLNQYADKTFAKVDYSTHDGIIANYHFDDRATTIHELNLKIMLLEAQGRRHMILLLTFAIIAAIYVTLSKEFSKNEFMVFTLISLIFLAIGASLPMIEIDARISSMNFSLLGEPVKFEDQVLYYKSKSILEVIQLMISQSRIDLLSVGLLVFTFSVLFPIAKLVCTVIYIYTEHSRSNKFIQFIVFKTGKWSMADVMVIAIFMSYIGFSGIITEQLKQIEGIAENIDILTTNKSNLLAGFYAFTAFSILSLLISHKLQFGATSVERIENIEVHQL